MNLNEMTVPQLREIAADLYVTGRSKMKKAELIDAIESHRQAEQNRAAERDAYLKMSNAERAKAQAEMDERNRYKGNIDGLANAEADAECERSKNATAPESRIKIERNRPGGALASFFIDGGVRNAWVTRDGASWVLVDSFDPQPIRVRATTFDKLAKLWAKKVGVVVEEIDVTKTF